MFFPLAEMPVSCHVAELANYVRSLYCNGQRANCQNFVGAERLDGRFGNRDDRDGFSQRVEDLQHKPARTETKQDGLTLTCGD